MSDAVVDAISEALFGRGRLGRGQGKAGNQPAILLNIF